MQKDDLVYVGHMLETTEKALGSSTAKTEEPTIATRSCAWP